VFAVLLYIIAVCRHWFNHYLVLSYLYNHFRKMHKKIKKSLKINKLSLLVLL